MLESPGDAPIGNIWIKQRRLEKFDSTEMEPKTQKIQAKHCKSKPFIKDLLQIALQYYTFGITWIIGKPHFNYVSTDNANGQT